MLFRNNLEAFKGLEFCSWHYILKLSFSMNFCVQKIQLPSHDCALIDFHQTWMLSGFLDLHLPQISFDTLPGHKIGSIYSHSFR